jgi:hypothetical protein
MTARRALGTGPAPAPATTTPAALRAPTAAELAASGEWTEQPAPLLPRPTAGRRPLGRREP